MKLGEKKYLLKGIIYLILSIICIFTIQAHLNDNLTIINPQSYPKVGTIWETNFTTSGTHNLTLKPVNGTIWSSPNSSTYYDLIFVSLYCGNTKVETQLINQTLHIENYSCDEQSKLQKKVITTGKHHILLTFGNQSKLTKNLATQSTVYNMGNRATYGHTAYEKGNGAPGSPTNYDAQATNTDYNNLATSNNQRWATSRANNDLEYDSQIYHFNISENLNHVTSLDFDWEGYSSETRTGYDLSIFIRNINSNSWEQIATYANGNTNEITVTDTINTNINNYIDTSDGNQRFYAYARFEHYDGGGSCPFVYSFDGKNYTMEHESFPFSVIKAAEKKTNDRLQHLEEVNGSYNLKIREELKEQSYIDEFKFYVVDHKGKGFVMPDINGKIHTIENLTQPISCEDKTGKACLYALSHDDLIFQSHSFKEINTSDKTTFRDEFNITFSKPENTTTAKLFMKIQKQSVLTHSWDFYIQNIGKNFWNFWQNLISKTFLGDLFNSAFDESVDLKIEQKTKNGWEKIGNVKAGMHMLDDFLFAFNVSENQENITLRVSSTKGFYEIDYMAMDFSENQEMNVHEISPKKAILNNEKNVSSQLLSKDSNYVTLNQWDEIDLEYQAIPEIQNWTRDYTMSITGYYNFIGFENQSLFGFIKGITYWVSSLLSPEKIPALLYKNIDFNSTSMNTLYTDYVQLEVFYEVGMTWATNSDSLGTLDTGTSNTKTYTFNATGFNSNIQISESGDTQGIFSVNQTTFSNMNEGNTRTIEITCQPTSSQTPGSYSATYTVFSNQHPGGDDLVVSCDVVDNENPVISTVAPSPGTTFINITNIPINATVTDNVGINSVEATIEYATGTDTLTLTDPNGDDIYTGIYNPPFYEGRYNVTIDALDSSSNSDSDTTWFISRQEFPPNITAVYPSTNGIYENETATTIPVTIAEPNSITFNISYFAESPVTIQWFLNGTELNGIENNTEFTYPGGFTTSGFYEVNVTVSNDIGQDSKLWELTINDTTKPDLYIFSPQNITYTTDNILINFTATFNNTDSLWYNNGTTNISYTTPIFETVPQGSNTFQFYSNTTNGSTQNKNVTFFVDSIAPNISINNPTNNSVFTSTNSVLVDITTTGDNTIFFNGTDNQTYTGPTTVDFPQGATRVKAWAFDNAGNVNSTFVDIFVDTAPPVITVYSPNSIIYPNSNITVNFTASDPFLDELWYNNGTNNITYNTPDSLNLSDGNYNFTFYANDTSGNIANKTINFSVDTTAPIINVTVPQNTSFVNTNIVPINFTATDPNLDSLWYFDGTNNNSYTGPTNRTLADGNYTWIFYAEDSVGNLAQYSSTFTVDAVPPTINVYSPVQDEEYLTFSDILINFTGNDPFLDELWYNNGTNNITYTSPTNITFTDETNASFTFYASDKAGNIVSQEINFTLRNKTYVDKDVKLSKKFITTNGSMNNIELTLENQKNITTNVTLIDFVDEGFGSGSYTLAPDLIDTTSGIWFNGDLIGWQFTLTPLSTVNINYSITGIGNNNTLLDNFMFALE